MEVPLDGQSVSYKLFDGDLSIIRSLWDDIFDDPEGFSDYYFSCVCNTNDIIVAEYNEEIIGMLHLNYYDLLYNGSCVKGVYVVGVAVKEEYRHNRIMTNMMKYSLGYAMKKGVKLAFLMPKKKEYYEALGFEAVYTTKTVRIGIGSGYEDFPRYDDYEVCLLANCDEAEKTGLANDINQALHSRYMCFAKRDYKYMNEMCLEHKCQNGDAFVVYDGERIAAVFSYDVYSDTIYVERLEMFGDCFSCVLHLLDSLAKHRGCSFCNITIPTDIFEELFEQSGDIGVAWLEENDLIYDVSDGYGIMAKQLQNIDEASGILEIKGNCFFDEIV